AADGCTCAGFEIVEVEAVVKEVEIALRSAGSVKHEAAGDLGLVRIATPVFPPLLGQCAGRTVDPRRAARAAAVAAVLDSDRVLHRTFRAAHGDVEAGKERIGVVRAELRPVPPLPTDSGGADDHVRYLAGEAGDLERCAIDDLDAFDVSRRDAAQLRHDVVRLPGEPLAIDDDVAGGLTEAARIFLLLDRKAGNA